MTTPIGQLEHRVSLQAPVDGTGPAGDPKPTFVESAVVWAMIDDLRGEERDRAKRIESRASTLIVIENFPALRTTWRIVWTARGRTVVYQIVSIENWHHRDWQQRITAMSVEDEAPNG